MRHLLLTLTAVVLSASAANAAVITRTYTNTSTFASGPVSNLTLTYTVTFDPTNLGNAPILNSLTSSSSLAAFAGPNAAAFFQSGGFNYLAVGGTTNFGVLNVQNTNPDFYTFFRFNAAGDVLGTDANAVSYSVPRMALFNSIASVTAVVPATAPVPEPATWAMMVGGFGLIGATVRRRRVTVRYA